MKPRPGGRLVQEPFRQALPELFARPALAQHHEAAHALDSDPRAVERGQQPVVADDAKPGGKGRGRQGGLAGALAADGEDARRGA